MALVIFGASLAVSALAALFLRFRLARMPGVKVRGYVPRIRDYLARATVAVAPIQAGTGGAHRWWLHPTP